MNLSWIKKVYLYLVSLISLVIFVIAGIMLINLGLKTWVFPKADTNYYSNFCSKITPIAAPNGEVISGDPTECANSQQAQDERSAQKQRDASQALAMIIVATPVFFYHWRLARKEV